MLESALFAVAANMGAQRPKNASHASHSTPGTAFDANWVWTTYGSFQMVLLA